MKQTDQLLLAFALVDLVATLIPGPAVMAVMGIALTGSLRGMAGAIAGINFGNLIWYAMVGAGLAALAHSVPQLFLVLRWAGTAYLFWLGIQTWRSHAHLTFVADRPAIGAWRGFSGAVAVQLSNPKALVFFTVFLPPFLDLYRPIVPQLTVLAAVGVTLEVLALLGYGLIAYRLGKFAMSRNAESWIARISGSILMAVATAMALSRAS